jgi:hypothetical protein
MGKLKGERNSGVQLDPLEQTGKSLLRFIGIETKIIG